MARPIFYVVTYTMSSICDVNTNGNFKSMQFCQYCEIKEPSENRVDCFDDAGYGF